MKRMKLWRIVFLMLAAFSLSSCSNEPEWADPEAHERTEQLKKQYTPLIVGTWHYERVGERQRYFERLDFKEDGKLTGMRKWQRRSLVTIDGKEQYTDWEDVELGGTFSGTWSLRYWAPDDGEKRNCLLLEADYEGDKNWELGYAYSYVANFSYADATTLCFQGYYVRDDDGWIHYKRGAAEPSF